MSNNLFLGELLLIVSTPVIVLGLSNCYEVIELFNTYNTSLGNWYSGIFMERAEYTDLQSLISQKPSSWV